MHHAGEKIEFQPACHIWVVKRGGRFNNYALYEQEKGGSFENDTLYGQGKEGRFSKGTLYGWEKLVMCAQENGVSE